MASAPRSRVRATWMLLLTAAVGAVASGCAPSCEKVCEKALDCDLTARLNQVECEEACLEQEDAFADHRRCIVDATCEELEDGVCYDEDLYIF